MMENDGSDYAALLFKALPEEPDIGEAVIATCLLLAWLIRCAVGVNTRRTPTHDELKQALGLAEDCFRGIRASIAYTPERPQ